MDTYYNPNQPNKVINRYNPLALPSLKNLDVEKLENDFAKELQKRKSAEDREKVYLMYFNIKRELRKLIENDDGVKDILGRVKMAQINKDRFHQINEKQTRQLQEIVNRLIIL